MPYAHQVANLSSTIQEMNDAAAAAAAVAAEAAEAAAAKDASISSLQGETACLVLHVWSCGYNGRGSAKHRAERLSSRDMRMKDCSSGAKEMQDSAVHN